MEKPQVLLKGIAWLMFASVGTREVSAQNIAQLEARVRQLEALIAAGEGGGARVQAPFTVVDSKGAPILEVNKSGSGEFLILSPSSPARVVLRREAEAASVVVANPSKIAILRSDAAGASVAVNNPSATTRMGVGPQGEQGFFVGDAPAADTKSAHAKPAAVWAELAAKPGEAAVLRLRDVQGNTVVAAGSNKARNGLGQVGINAPGQKIGLLLTTGAAGDGEVSVYSNGSGKEVVRLDGQNHRVQLFNRAGTSAATIGLGQDGAGSGGNFTAYGAGGGVFSAGSLGGNGGAACIIHPKRGNVCLN